MFFGNMVFTTLIIVLSLNILIAILFWLHEKLESAKATRLRYAVEKAVWAVEQACAHMASPEKKREAVRRVQALLGWYRIFIPELVIDSAIEAEVYLINRLHSGLSVDHDTPEEVMNGEGSH